MARWRGRLTGPDDPRHGTANAYMNCYCRCDACRSAWADYHRAYLHRRGVLSIEQANAKRRENPPAHGTLARYARSWGCRCDACRAASARAKADYRARQRAKVAA